MLARMREIEEEERLENSWWARFQKKLPDADEVFSYSTQQEMIVIDRRLGYIFYISLLVIFLYIVVFVRKSSFIINKCRTLALNKSTYLQHTKQG